MTPRRERAQLVPNANNPRLLQRLIRLVASGVRKPRALADVLQVEVRTVHYYTQAGEWLGLLATDKEVHLTPRGVEFAFADPRQRTRLYALAVWSVPLVQSLLTGRGDLPDADVIASFILQHEEGMAPRTARRRATALRGLIEPALRHRPTKSTSRGTQISLRFPSTGTVGIPAQSTHGVDLRAGTENNPDVYARLLQALLDHGELTTGQVRGILDAIGARDCPLGGYVEMALRREDATRSGDRLIVTASAVQRREVADDGILTALTDPTYRAYLDQLCDTEDSLLARRELDSLSRRFTAWDVRIFGERLTPENVAEVRDRPLVGRRLASLVRASDRGPVLPPSSQPFIDMLDTPLLPIAFPSSLAGLYGGVATVNEALKRARTAPAGVRVPTPIDTRAQIHGGLLCPGETLPRAIPDNLTLRLRMMTHTPAVSLLVALLLLDRKESADLRLVGGEDGPTVHWSGQSVGPLLEVLEGFCRDQGWVVVRPATGGLQASTLIDVCEDLGLVARVRSRVVLAEPVFMRLQEDAESRVAYECLLPLEDRLHAWLDTHEE
jgi:hypothetical protein